MNPSSTGWIHKFINEFPKKMLVDGSGQMSLFYETLKETGFIYGVSVKTVLKEPVSSLKLTKEELTKINLFHSLLFVYFKERASSTSEDAIEEMVSFYQTIEKGKPGFFQLLSFTKSPSENLEKIIAARLQESNNLIKNEAASLFTYALLFGDVLAFQYYLTHSKGLKHYLEDLERTLILFSVEALQSKKKKNKYDLLAIEMVMDASQLSGKWSEKPEAIHMGLKKRSVLEKKFVLDICCLAVWDDKKLDADEWAFLQKTEASLGLPKKTLEDSIQTLKEFSSNNAPKIKLFEYSHPVKQLYKQSTSTVKLLVLRNKNRLLTELNESGELLRLLSQSTLRELSTEEKQKVKTQLLDICKTVPSLTIFLLPGGSLLLPLLVKLIPQLLPSAFNENRVED